MNKNNYVSDETKKWKEKADLMEAIDDVIHVTCGGLIVIMLIEAFTMVF